MSPLNLDFSSIPERTPLAEGIYVITIENVEETVAQSSGNPMLKLRYAVEGHPQNKLFDNCVLTENALWKLKELLGALGYATEAIVELNPQELVGQSLKAQVTFVAEGYNGNPENKVKKLMPL